MAHQQTQSQYKRGYEDAREAIHRGDTHKGVALCQTLLADNDLPRYYRIKTLVLLASVTTEWRKKEELRLCAEHSWDESRALFPEGQNAKTDTTLGELRGLLNGLGATQKQGIPSNYEDTLSAALAETEIEDLADIADGELEALADQEYERSKDAGSSVKIEDNVKPTSLIDKGPIQPLLPKSTSNLSFAPASTLRASQQVLGHSGCGSHSRNGQTAGSRMLQRRHGITRRSA